MQFVVLHERMTREEKIRAVKYIMDVCDDIASAIVNQWTGGEYGQWL